jgi:thiol-disulfide isomerase/thioredoxin
MPKLYTPEPALGSLCPDFDLPSTAGVSVTRASSSRDSAGVPVDALLVMFICNHCPYVKAIEDRLVKLSEMFRDRSVSLVAISSNDTEKYGEDSFDKMKLKKYPFPYLYDESQDVAMAFGAVCTPDFFLYDRELKLTYRGRLDDSWQDESKVTSRDLAGAIESLLQGMHPNREQKPSMGCSLKWKPGKEPPPARPLQASPEVSVTSPSSKGSR